MKSPQSVDEYIANTPLDVHEKLKKLRTIIKSIAPLSEERISYGMPYYGYKGRLVYFRLSKKHIGLYIPPPVIEQHIRLLKGYENTKATLRLPLDKPLPIDLIKQLIKARVKINKESLKNK